MGNKSSKTVTKEKRSRKPPSHMFQNGLDLTIKTVNSNSPWAFIREGLLSEGYLRLRFGGLIFGRAYIWEGYNPNFTV